MYECYEDPTIKDSHVGEGSSQYRAMQGDTACSLNVSQTSVSRYSGTFKRGNLMRGF